MADYNKNEKWEFWTDDAGKKWAKVTGRERIPDSVKRDIAFAFKLDGAEQWLDDGTTAWWAPGWPQWIRQATWLARNPFASRYISTVIWGVQDRNYTVEVTEGANDPLLTQRDDIGQTGWQRATLHLDDGTKRYWRSYVGKSWLTWYYGVQPSGLFAVKLNRFIPFLASKK